MKQNEQDVASLFDEMANEYDQISDLWYSWLFANVHLFISKDLLSTSKNTDANGLDIGCGTGYQTILFSLAGIQTEGIDISPALVQLATEKKIDQFITKPFFESPFSFVKEFHQKTIQNITVFRDAGYTEPKYQIASALDLPYSDASFQYVNCIGSVLSFLDNYHTGLKEISRVLKPGGYFFLEFENKYNLDLIWSFFDSCIKGRIGYEQPIRESWKNLTSSPSKHLQIEFPFSKHGETINMPIWIFKTGALVKEMRNYGLAPLEIRSVHNITNLIPSVWLDNHKPSKGLIRSFYFLSAIEKNISSVFPINRLGCSTYIFGRKQ